MNRAITVLCLLVVSASFSDATFDLLKKKLLHKSPSYAPAYPAHPPPPPPPPQPIYYHASIAVPYAVPTPVHYAAPAPAPVQYSAPAPAPVYAAPAPAPVQYSAPAPAP
uniref:VM domain-containing protein n=1 Tax=Anopheles maculatus TaxID=74869 RepID=A0A182S6L6_9DIPT